MHRRKFLTAAGISGAAFAAGVTAAKANHVNYDEFCHTDTALPPPPTSSPPPPPPPPSGGSTQLPQRELLEGNLFHKNKTNLVLENFSLKGRLQIINCPGVIVRNFDIFGIVNDKWGNLMLDNCPGAVIEDCESHSNPRGHGLFTKNDMNGTVVRRYESYGCQEDGFQADNSAFGMIRFIDANLHDNFENAVDIKGGSCGFTGGRFQTGTGNHEPIVVQNSAESIHMDGALIVDNPQPGREKALASVFQGKAIFEDCRYQIDRNAKWFRADNNAQYDFQDLGDPFNLVTQALTITGGTRV